MSRARNSRRNKIVKPPVVPPVGRRCPFSEWFVPTPYSHAAALRRFQVSPERLSGPRPQATPASGSPSSEPAVDRVARRAPDWHPEKDGERVGGGCLHGRAHLYEAVAHLHVQTREFAGVRRRSNSCAEESEQESRARAQQAEEMAVVVLSHKPVARMTETEISAALSAAWPVVERRLDERLARRGADKPTREDISQEVAARVLSREVSFTSADDLLPWAVTVADRLLIDHARRTKKSVLVEEVPEREDKSPCPGQIISARVEAEGVAAAIAGLKPVDQEAFSLALQGVVPGETKRQRDAHALRLHRARTRLRRVIDPIAAFICAAWVRRARGATPVVATFATVALTTTLWTSPVQPHGGADASPAIARDPSEQQISPPSIEQPRRDADRDQARSNGGGPAAGPSRRERMLPRVDGPIPEGALVSTEVGGTEIEGGTSENTDEKPLACVTEVAVLDLCLDQPVR